MRVNVTTAEGTTAVVIPQTPTLRPVIGTRYAETFVRPEVTVNDEVDAAAGDQFKWIILDGSVQPAIYHIDPSLFTALTLYIAGGDDVTQGATIIIDSGVIKLKTNEDVTELALLARQPIMLYSDGTNLKEK